MIKREDISNFFDYEAEASKKSWEENIKLPLKDRIRKRKAIQSVYLDRDYRDITEENYILLKLKVNVNLSDFKEGECLILHKENTTSGFECDLYSFEGDNYIFAIIANKNDLKNNAVVSEEEGENMQKKKMQYLNQFHLKKIKMKLINYSIL